MNTTFKQLITAGLITVATVATAKTESQVQFSASHQGIGEYTAEQPAIYDLGLDTAIIFSYENTQGERMVVTTVGPKDPDANRPATEHSVKLDQGESYTVTLASSDPSVEPIAVTLRFDDSGTMVASNR